MYGRRRRKYFYTARSPSFLQRMEMKSCVVAYFPWCNYTYSTDFFLYQGIRNKRLIPNFLQHNDFRKTKREEQEA